LKVKFQAHEIADPSPWNLCPRKENVFVKPNDQSQTSLGFGMTKKRRMKFNVFIKPSEQSYACISFGMTKKRRMKSNVKKT